MGNMEAEERKEEGTPSGETLEVVRAQKNVERFFAEEKENTEKTQTR